MSYIQVYTKLNDKVYRAIDAIFDAVYDTWILDSECLNLIKAIDGSVIVDTTFLRFQSAFGLISPEQFSSGVKSLLLLHYRIQHPQLLWIPSLDSMGSNAKDYAFEHLLVSDYLPVGQDFPVYCTILDMSEKYWYLQCKDSRGEIKALAEIVCEV